MRTRNTVRKTTTVITGVLMMLAAMTITPTAAMAEDHEALESGACGDSAIITDTGLSTFVGGDLTYKSVSEVEGSVIVDGNIHNAVGMLGGHVMWGMGVDPAWNTDAVIAGGNLQVSDFEWIPRLNGMMLNAGATGSIRIGGSATTIDGAPAVSKPADSTRDRLIAIDNKTASQFSQSNQAIYKAYLFDAYSNEQRATWTVEDRLGKTKALKARVNGKTVDYNNYLDRVLRPMSEQYATLSATGTVSWSAAPVKTAIRVENSVGEIDETNAGLLTFIGDSHSKTQVFDLDYSKAESWRTANGKDNWSLDFENMPDDAIIIINVVDSGDLTLRPGWQMTMNGKDKTTQIDADPEQNGYRDFASSIMWNFPNASHVTLDKAHGIIREVGKQFFTDLVDEDKGKDIYWLETGTPVTMSRGVLFPGSILLPNGSMYDYADTNGRLLIGKDLIFDIWEHHNAPWRGIQQGCVTLQTTSSSSSMNPSVNQSVWSMQGIEYNVYKTADGTGTPLTTFIIDGNGKSNWISLPKGTYYAIETRTNDRYERNPNPIEFTVSTGDKLEVKSEILPLPLQDSLPMTGDFKMGLMLLISLSVMIIIIVFNLRSNQRTSKRRL